VQAEILSDAIARDGYVNLPVFSFRDPHARGRLPLKETANRRKFFAIRLG
jgi:hypothetical protein